MISTSRLTEKQTFCAPRLREGRDINRDYGGQDARRQQHSYPRRTRQNRATGDGKMGCRGQRLLNLQAEEVACGAAPCYAADNHFWRSCHFGRRPGISLCADYLPELREYAVLKRNDIGRHETERRSHAHRPRRPAAQEGGKRWLTPLPHNRQSARRLRPYIAGPVKLLDSFWSAK